MCPLTDAAVLSAAVGTAGGAAGAGAAVGTGVSLATVGSALGAVSAGVGIAGTLGAFGRKGPVLPPSPMMSPATIDQTAEQAQQEALGRQRIAGGINSTVGTPGGQAGAVMNPASLGQKTLLGM